jgi:hypothetical protein
MKKSNILIVVKTYPEVSNKYTETVCTAGIIADTKRLVRICRPDSGTILMLNSRNRKLTKTEIKGWLTNSALSRVLLPAVINF